VPERHATEMCGRAEEELHVFIAIALCTSEWSASRSGQLTLRERLPHWIGGWLDSKSSLEPKAKRRIPGTAGD
jgi:hypothetical protein